jgi:hypothetical protein
LFGCLFGFLLARLFVYCDFILASQLFWSTRYTRSQRKDLQKYHCNIYSNMRAYLDVWFPNRRPFPRPFSLRRSISWLLRSRCWSCNWTRLSRAATNTIYGTMSFSLSVWNRLNSFTILLSGWNARAGLTSSLCSGIFSSKS